MIRTVVSDGVQPFETDNAILVQSVALRQLSPKDVRWDVRRSESDRIKELYKGTVFDALAGRIEGCSGRLEFAFLVDPETGEIKLKLQSARFCRVRHCSVCQWRRSAKMQSKAFKIFPKVRADFPKHQYIFLTLTVRNCPLVELRSQLDQMNRAWNRLTQRKAFPADGWIRSTEVTRAADGSAHPHFHCLLMVPPSYFTGAKYLSQEAWGDLWQRVCRSNYKPMIHVKKVRPKKGTSDLDAAILETLKYSVKPSDMIGESDGNPNDKDREWLLELTSQLHKTRAIATGGILKEYLKVLEEEPVDLVHIEEDTEVQVEDAPIVCTDWHTDKRQYLVTDGEESTYYDQELDTAVHTDGDFQMFTNVPEVVDSMFPEVGKRRKSKK